MTSIINCLYKHSKRIQDSNAVFDGKCYHTYSELFTDIHLCASNLNLKYKIKRNNFVFIDSNLSYPFICNYFAVQLLGAIAIPINFKEILDSALKLFDVSSAPFILSQKLMTANLKVSTNLISLDFPNPQSLSDITFTSGTTSFPKGVQHTHSQQYMACQHIIKHLNTTSNDRELLLMPLYHSFGLGRMRSTLVAGACIYLGSDIKYLKRFFHFIDSHSISTFGLVPSAWRFIRSLSRDKISQYSHKIRAIEFGSAKLTKHEKLDIKRLLPSTLVKMHYGSTEVSRALFINIHTDPDNIVGYIDSSTSVRILDKNNNILADNQEGEICIKSPWMSSSYFNNETLSRLKFFDSFFKTGDLGFISDSKVVLTGRLSHQINVGGRMVNPSNIEDVINSIDFVRECVCLPAKDPILGESILACIVLHPSSKYDEQAIRDKLSSVFPTYMCPTRYIKVDSLPKTHNGKLKRDEIKLLYT